MALNEASGRLEPLQTKQYAQTKQALTTPEARYWKAFKHPVLLRQYAAVTNISFSGVSPWDFAVTSSTRVQLFDAATSAPRKAFSRFQDVVYSGTLRADGQVLVAGGEEGLVRVCDVGSRMVLRTLGGHAGPVHVTSFVHSRPEIVSAGDDTTVRHWDMATGAALGIMRGHTDRVRAAAVSPADATSWATGAYDHTVRLWDARTGQTTRILQHDAPIESVVWWPSGTLVAVASGSQVRVWDVVQGAQLACLENHAKTVTALALDTQPDRPRLLSCSLDQHVKVYEATTWEVLHTMKYPAPLLCLAISPVHSHLVAGMSDGMLSIRQRALGEDERQRQREEDKARHPERSLFDLGTPSVPRPPHRVTNWRFWQRGADADVPEDAAEAPAEGGRRRLRPWERHLAQFQFKRALDSALATLTDPAPLCTLLEELRARNALGIALGGRTATTLLPLLRFLGRHAAVPAYAPVLVPIADEVVSIYSSVLGESDEVDLAFATLLRALELECRAHEQLARTLGQLDALLAHAH